MLATGGRGELEGDSERRKHMTKPFLIQMVSALQDDAIGVLNALPLTRNRFVGWGAGCLDERSLGRAGFCTFKVANGAAARDFGHATLNQLKMPPQGADVMVRAYGLCVMGVPVCWFWHRRGRRIGRR